jgi:glycosyltransferase involved in cell wall biosynthesis
MYIGRPTPHKNLRRLIDAFALLQKKYPDLTLALAGKKDSNYTRHETYVNERGIKNVVFTGFISDEQLRWMYENTAVYCFPSLSEGFGLPGLEAMLHGAPVASSTATCLPETHGDAARYFDPFSVEDIAKSIDDILSDDKLRNELVKKGKKHVKTFSWQRMAEQTLAVYEKYGRKS